MKRQNEISVQQWLPPEVIKHLGGFKQWVSVVTVFNGKTTKYYVDGRLIINPSQPPKEERE